MTRVDRWVRFLIVSGFAAVLSLALIEIARTAVDLSIPQVHVAVVACSYFAAARVNFDLQRRWTFSGGGGGGGEDWRRFLLFLGINGSLSLAVGAISILLIRTTPLTAAFGPAAVAISLIAAALIVAPLSFVLTRRLLLEGAASGGRPAR